MNRVFPFLPYEKPWHIGFGSRDFIGRLRIRQIDIFNNTVHVDLETISGRV